MKQLTLLLVAVMIYATTNAQYTAYLTSMYTSDGDEWIKYSTNEVDIPIINKGKHVIIHAKSTSSYELGESENIKGDNYVGVRYKAVELLNQRKCIFDIITFDTGVNAIRIYFRVNDTVYQLIYLYNKD